ncbi:MAG: EF-Tu/IF-2/RF-3 family GTPase [Pyrinomonadaceae bacterium]
MRFLLLILTILAVFTAASAQLPTPAPEPFLLAVEDAFYISGRGVVATGKVERGTLKTGDTVEIVGSKPIKTATIAGIEMSRKVVSEAKAGDQVGVILRGTERGDVERGQILAKPGSVKAYTKIKATIDLLESHERGRSTPIFDKYRGLFYFRTVGFSGVVSFPIGVGSIAPGKKGTSVEIIFEKPVPVEVGQDFSIRESGRTVGSGKVTALIQ